jgi:hypothetical protein
MNEEEIRHVRFGGVEDVDQEIEKRASWQAANSRAVGTYPMEDPSGEMNITKNPVYVNNHGPSQPIRSSSRRVPPPTINSWEEDEKASDAAAAREIGLELEALNNQNQLSPDVYGGGTMMASTQRSNNQLPHPYAELNPPGTYPHYVTPQPYVQEAYQTTPDSHAQSFEQQQKQQMDMRNALPPRFQAYNNKIPVESQVPPRFQNRSSSPTKPRPPRFQTSYTPPVSSPGGLNM